MSAVTIVPGCMTLTDWRAIYHGAKVTLQRECLSEVEASARAVRDIVSRGEKGVTPHRNGRRP